MKTKKLMYSLLILVTIITTLGCSSSKEETDNIDDSEYDFVKYMTRVGSLYTDLSQWTEREEYDEGVDLK